MAIIEEEADYEASGTLSDTTDEELSTTEQAIEVASQRVQVLLKRSRENDTGVKLEVNEKLLSSCADFMEALKDLMTCGKNLLEEITNVSSYTAHFHVA